MACATYAHETYSGDGDGKRRVGLVWREGLQLFCGGGGSVLIGRLKVGGGPTVEASALLGPPPALLTTTAIDAATAKL